MVRSLFIWSRDLWNGERGENSDLRNAKYVFANAASEQEKKEWPFCSLYYEEGTADDNDLTPIAFAERTVDFEGSKLTVKTVRCTNEAGNTIDFTFPDPKSVSQDYDLRSAGAAGQVNYIPAGSVDGQRQGGVTFHVDEIMEMDGAAEKNREKVKEFLAKQIDAKISSAMGSDDKSAEVYHSEYSVERVNPTVVSGAEDVRAESFGAESYEADESVGETEMVEFTESPADLVLPEGEGNVIGQSTPTTDFTPFGSRAEEYNAYDDPISDRQEYKIKQLGGKVDKSMNRSKASDYIKELQGRESGTWRAEGFGGEGFASDGFYPEGSGRVLGDITADADYTPFGSRAEEDEYEASHSGGMGSKKEMQEKLARIPEASRSRRSASRRMGRGSLGSFGRGFGSSSSFATEEDNFFPDGDGRIIGAKTSTTEYEPFGSNAEEDNFFPDGDGRIIGAKTSTTEYEPFGSNAEDAVIDESSMDTVYPEGDGRITGQSIAGTDFTPLGSRAEGFKGGVFTGVASAFVVGLLANLLMNNKTKDDAPDGPNAPEDGGE